MEGGEGVAVATYESTTGGLIGKSLGVKRLLIGRETGGFGDQRRVRRDPFGLLDGADTAALPARDLRALVWV